MPTTTPIVLSLSGHDPTGGAGIQADIETCVRLGCHACTVVTALTVQDTADVRRVIPQPVDDFLEQATVLLDDLPVAVVKIGLLGSADLAHAVADLLADHPDLPVVLDPILAAGGGRDLAAAELIEAIRTRLLPRTALLTPNTPEARRLTGRADPDACGRVLLDAGCAAVLLTGTHDAGPDVVNRLYRPGGTTAWTWPRLPETYHGSGCTLASAAAAYLALGLDLEAAAARAQEFAWAALNSGIRLGRGQWLPRR
jgi:hydroxymethylpyrimidine/phosphomethylpyrimidine kinase